MIELELKAVVPDPAGFREALRRVAGEPRFRGLMRDRRFDRDGELTHAGQVLRVRRLEPLNGESADVVAWKGDTVVSDDGYKARHEIECRAGGPDEIAELLLALRYQPVEQIDRYVETWSLDGATVRLEWYPEFDTLVEIEGSGDAIEAAIARVPLPRDAFTADRLVTFVERFVQRTGRSARLRLGSDDERPEHWP